MCGCLNSSIGLTCCFLKTCHFLLLKSRSINIYITLIHISHTYPYALRATKHVQQTVRYPFPVLAAGQETNCDVVAVRCLPGSEYRLIRHLESANRHECRAIYAWTCLCGLIEKDNRFSKLNSPSKLNYPLREERTRLWSYPFPATIRCNNQTRNICSELFNLPISVVQIAWPRLHCCTAHIS